MFSTLICYLHHGVSYDLIAQHIALLEHCRNDVLAELVAFNVRHRVVQCRVKRLADLADLADAQLFKACLKLVRNHLNAFFHVLCGGVFLCQRTVDVVGDR